MKIVAGLGSVDDYIRLAKAGADEFFCGYVPYEWNKKYGSVFPLNRREVLYYNVQINSLSEMRILRRMIDKYKVPVTITFNALYYLEEQYEMIVGMIRELMEIGFREFIIADIGLILYLKKKNVGCIIHLSGECAELNEMSIKVLNHLNISRYIFHRKNTIKDMEECIEKNEIKGLQYEAFILNERCHYTGAFCSSLHCDELTHLCKLPYDIGKVDLFKRDFKSVDEKLAFRDECSSSYDEEHEGDKCYIVGSTGCGICFLRDLQKAGITHLKVVGRGNYIDAMEKDILGLRKSLTLLETSDDCIDYSELVKEALFKGNCSKECYY